MKGIVAAAGGEPLRKSQGRYGMGIELSGVEAESPHVAATLSMSGGAISFWIKPEWITGRGRSHTLMSARWNDQRQSYLAVSDGWWEPAGSERLYFIVSNEDLVHCSSDQRLAPGVWSLITVTWASGPRGFCKLFVDDELRAMQQRSWSGNQSLQPLQLGADSAASNRRGRTANAQLAGLRFSHRPLTHREIRSRYLTEEDPASLTRKKWSWLDLETERRSLERAGQPATGGFKRVVFDEDSAWSRSARSIDERIDRLVAAGINVYVPCVWHGRGTWFPSTLAGIDSSLPPRERGWDPLEYLIRRAHERGIEVHPWFTVVRREDDSHPEWAASGTPTGAYDVHHPEFRRFAEDLMLDVVSRYAVDGINLDYIRSMGLCLSRYCIDDYRSRTGGDLRVDFANGAPDIAVRRRIEGWQDDAVEELVREFSQRAREIKPALVISVDGFGMPSSKERPLEGRNELSWANQGLIDIIFHMDYRPEIDLKAVNAARTELRDPRKLWLLAAVYDSVDDVPESRSGEWVSRLVGFTEKAQERGIGLYTYDLLSHEQIGSLSPRPGVR